MPILEQAFRYRYLVRAWMWTFYVWLKLVSKLFTDFKTQCEWHLIGFVGHKEEALPNQVPRRVKLGAAWGWGCSDPNREGWHVWFPWPGSLAIILDCIGRGGSGGLKWTSLWEVARHCSALHCKGHDLLFWIEHASLDIFEVEICIWVVWNSCVCGGDRYRSISLIITSTRESVEAFVAVFVPNLSFLSFTVAPVTTIAEDCPFY